MVFLFFDSSNVGNLMDMGIALEQGSNTALGTRPEMVSVLRFFCPTEKSITATVFGIDVFPMSILQIIESFGTW
jgi:hypothetical protein